MNEFLAKPVTLLRTMQDQCNAVKVLISEASKNKCLSQLSGDLDALLRKLVRVIKVVGESVTSPPARSDIQKLLKMVDKLDVEFVPLGDACTAFGLNKSSKGSKRCSNNSWADQFVSLCRARAS